MNSLKLLILVERYPDPKSSASAFVHSRVKAYLNNEVLVTVLSFSSRENYCFEDVQVITKEHFNKHHDVSDFDLIISHAPNLRNHVIFLLRHLFRLPKMIFFIHGHEVLQKSKFYPPPYSFQKSQKFLRWFNDIYDLVKRPLLSFFFASLVRNNKAKFVFVSKWMFRNTTESLGITESLFEHVSEIIPNPVNDSFIHMPYEPENSFDADFVTIRNLDVPKYAIDILVKACREFPQFSFAVYGQGDYFKYNDRPANLKHYPVNICQKDLPDVLNRYKFSFMPTKLDAQGVMACEIASTGMPLLSSANEGCMEFLSDLPNVRFFDNQTFDLTKLIDGLKSSRPQRLIEQLHPDCIARREIEFFKEALAANLMTVSVPNKVN